MFGNSACKFLVIKYLPQYRAGGILIPGNPYL